MLTVPEQDGGHLTHRGTGKEPVKGVPLGGTGKEGLGEAFLDYRD